MRLRDFFSTAGNSEITSSNFISEESSLSMEAAKYKLLQQIQALVPGQTLQGKIVGRENAQVQIQLASDLTVSARLESEIPIELGKTMTFLVKNNGKGLTLSPLFENLSTDENVMKALDMAGIPVSQRTVSMTEGMMREGLSIDKQSLQAMFKLVNTFPQTAPETIVKLQKLGIEINGENVEQAENYQSLNHQVEKGLDAVMKEFAVLVDTGYEQGKIAETNQLMQTVITAVTEETAENPETAETNTQAETNIQAETNTQAEINTQSEAKTQAETKETISTTESGKEKIQFLLNRLLHLPESTDPETAGKVHRQLAKEIVELFQKDFKEQFQLQPKQVGEGRPVPELYEKLQRQLTGLTEAVSPLLGKESTFLKGVEQLQNNLDFMNQLNQMFHFVQLPLKLNESNAHGDLYVYTNKKNLSSKDGSISAFLHLDMEHLGSVDVYVTMQDSRVGTRFQVADEEILDFLYSHMHILDERLQKRGYSLSYEMKVKEEESSLGVLDTILKQDRNVSMLSQHAFDVRA